MLTVFLKLLLAHLLGDFLLQPKSWVTKRKENILYLLLHVLVHIVLMVVFFANELSSYWMSIVFVGCSHLAIDSFKIWWEKKYPFKPVILFLTDQLLHVLVLVGVIIYNFGIPDNAFAVLFSNQSLLYVIALLLIAVVSPIFLRVFFTKWDQENDFVLKRKDSLMNAGMLIGIMERFIIVLFIQVGFLPGIGFLLAAKSIFRFGDLTNAKNTKFTEYILVGTLTSFVIAIIVGYLLKLSLTLI